MLTKEYLNYKDRVILEQKGRWFSLYVDGSVLYKNMCREEGTQLYFTYVKIIKGELSTDSLKSSFNQLKKMLSSCDISKDDNW